MANISVLLSNNEKIFIQNANEPNNLRVWLKEEKAFWNDIVQNNNNENCIQNVRNIIVAGLNELDGVINNLQDAPDEMKKQFQNRLERQYVHSRDGIYSKSITGKIIQIIKERHGKVAASSALAVAMGHKYNPAIYDQMRGVIAYTNGQDGVTNKTPTATKRALEDLIGRYNETIEVANISHENVSRELERLTKTMKTRKKSLTNWAKKQGEKYIEKTDKDAKEAIDNINNTQQVYAEFMKLRAPAKYWQDKAVEHKSKAESYKTMLIGFSIGGVGVLLTTAIIWPVRILIRLYLSEHHLAIDSVQRETMTMTYLAMIDEKAADTEQRKLIIEALFRPAADGLVKDDAAPHWLMAKHFTN